MCRDHIVAEYTLANLLSGQITRLTHRMSGAHARRPRLCTVGAYVISPTRLRKVNFRAKIVIIHHIKFSQFLL